MKEDSPGTDKMFPPNSPNKVFFMVQFGNIRLFTYAFDREDAKRNASHWIPADADKYVVTPLTNPGDRIHLDITLYV